MGKKIEKTVMLNFQPIQVTLKVNQEISTEELLQLAEEAVIKQIATKTTRYSFSVKEGGSLQLEESSPGLIVKEKSSGKICVIYAIKPNNKYPIEIVMEGVRRLKVMPISLEPVKDNIHIDAAVFGREAFLKETDEWVEGHTGYFRNKNELIPFVVNKVTKKEIRIFPISHKKSNNYYPLTVQHKSLMLDTKDKD